MKDLSLHILDIAQNSIRAEATFVEITIEENIPSDLLSITICDNGFGMNPETVERVIDPFFTSRTTRKVGLGIPLLKMNAERCGGRFTITSEEKVGTEVIATFSHSNIDRPPLGDIAGVVVILVTANPALEFVYQHTYNGRAYCFDTREVKEALDGLPINDLKVVRFLKEMIKENLDEIQIGE